MLDSEHENPELIWNEDTRKKVAKVVSEECGKLFQSQKQSSETLWSVPENFQLSLEDVSGEVVVSGVYLRLFVANPGANVEQYAIPDNWQGVPPANAYTSTLELAVGTKTVWKLPEQPDFVFYPPEDGEIESIFPLSHVAKWGLECKLGQDGHIAHPPSGLSYKLKYHKNPPHRWEAEIEELRASKKVVKVTDGLQKVEIDYGKVFLALAEASKHNAPRDATTALQAHGGHATREAQAGGPPALQRSVPRVPGGSRASAATPPAPRC